MEKIKGLNVRIEKKVVIWMRRFYVIAFNIYASFWLIRLIFFKQSSYWEEYILWFFDTSGMYFFVFDGRDIYLKRINRVK